MKRIVPYAILFLLLVTLSASAQHWRREARREFRQAARYGAIGFSGAGCYSAAAALPMATGCYSQAALPMSTGCYSGSVMMAAPIAAGCYSSQAAPMASCYSGAVEAPALSSPQVGATYSTTSYRLVPTTFVILP